MDALLIYGDTERSAALRHEVPIAIGDPFLFIGRNGSAPLIMTNALEHDRIALVLPEAELVMMNELGFIDMIRDGMPRDEAELEVVSRAVSRAGVSGGAVPPELPVAVADRLRADGIELTVDGHLFEGRRRSKGPAELTGIRRAQRAAEAGMAAGAATIGAAEAGADGLLFLDGEQLTAERVRAAVRDACAVAGAPAPPDIMVSSVFSGTGHDPGYGPLPAGLPIIIDLWPRDEETGCWADMTRTFVNGEVSAEVAALRDVVREALEAARAAARPGVTGRELYDRAAEVSSEPATRRSAPPSRPDAHARLLLLTRPRSRARDTRGAGARAVGQ